VRSAWLLVRVSVDIYQENMTVIIKPAIMQVCRSAASISGFTGTGTIADEQQGLPEGIH